MKKSGIRGVFVGVLALGVAAGARADRVIYRGEAPSAAGIRLAGWGSGIAINYPAEGYTGSQSISVSVDGFYSGGRIIFNNPVDLTADVTNPNAFLELVIQFRQGTIRPSTGAGFAGVPGGPGGIGSSFGGLGGEVMSPGGPGVPGDFGAGGFPGGGFPGGGFPGDPSQQVVPDTRFLKVVLAFDGAEAISHEHPLVTFTTPDPKWSRVAIPFAKFKSTAKLPRYMLREVRIFGDSPDTFYVGEIRTVTDTDPIVVEPIDEQVVSINDRVVFTATAEAGLSALKYSWDFDASDGIQEDAVGRRVTHVYRKESPENSPYRVTLTVTDMAGVKRPERVTTTVEVIP